MTLTWHALITFGKHTWWNEIACNPIIAISKHTRSDDVGRDMPSLLLDNTHGGTTSAWYAIIAFGHHIQVENVTRGM